LFPAFVASYFSPILLIEWELKATTGLCDILLEVEWLIASESVGASLAKKPAEVRCQRGEACFKPFLPGLVGFDCGGLVMALRVGVLPVWLLPPCIQAREQIRHCQFLAAIVARKP